MNIGIVGMGKLGLPVALAIESKGHNVRGYDINPKIEEYLEAKKIPYREENVDELIKNTKIRLDTMDKLVEWSDIIFVAVQTPHEPMFEGVTRLPDSRKDFDYSYLKNACKSISESLDKLGKPKIVTIISTVLPRTINDKVKPLLGKNVKLCYNPFFIAMGTTVQDFLNSEFILFGVDDKDAVKTMKDFYKTITNAPFCETTIVNAEIVKVSYNTWVTGKINFGNNLMELCHRLGGDCDEVIDILGKGFNRIISTQYMKGGMADGGSCHPRDNIALSYVARREGMYFDHFTAMMMEREKQTEWLADLTITESRKHPDLRQKPILILGKSYKPETNLTVGSPSFLLRNMFEEKNERVDMFDPYVDTDKNADELLKEPRVYFIGTKHSDFTGYKFPKGSLVIDPFRYIPESDEYTLISIGKGKNQ